VAECADHIALPKAYFGRITDGVMKTPLTPEAVGKQREKTTNGAYAAGPNAQSNGLRKPIDPTRRHVRGQTR